MGKPMGKPWENADLPWENGDRPRKTDKISWQFLENGDITIGKLRDSMAILVCDSLGLTMLRGI